MEKLKAFFCSETDAVVKVGEVGVYIILFTQIFGSMFHFNPHNLFGNFDTVDLKSIMKVLDFSLKLFIALNIIQ